MHWARYASAFRGAKAHPDADFEVWDGVFSRETTDQLDELRRIPRRASSTVVFVVEVPLLRLRRALIHYLPPSVMTRRA